MRLPFVAEVFDERAGTLRPDTDSRGGSGRVWRALLVGLAALAAGLVVFVLVSKNALFWSGNVGWALQPSARAFVVEVGSVSPHGTAAAAGVQAGDHIDMRAIAFTDRVFLLALPSPPAGQRLALTIERHGRVLHVDVVPKRTGPLRWSNWVGYLVLLWMAAFATLIAWRRPAMLEARLLSIALSCYVAGDVLQFLTVPSPGVDLVFFAINSGGMLGALSLVALVRFNALFGRPLTRTRRLVDGAAYGGAALLAFYGIASSVALGTVWFDPVGPSLGPWAVAIIAGAQVLVILSGACAIAASRGVERQRVAWAVASIGTLLAAYALQLVLNVLVPSNEMERATQLAVNVLSIAAPVGLTYSLLSRRLLDIGFALNRAAEFSAVSVVVVGAFMLIEWALGGWLVSASHVTSTWISVALALALGFSVRFVHGHVHHAVDHVLFRRRHEHEKALLRFAREASFISDTDTLLERAVDEIAEHAETGRVAIFVHDPSGSFVPANAAEAGSAPVDENDAALVAMRTSREAIDLQRCFTRLRGEYAFPMISRGELIGVIVCGAKRDGDPYAPDEIVTLTALASAVGTALDMLSSRTSGVQAAVVALRVEIAALRADLREVLEAMRLSEPT